MYPDTRQQRPYQYSLVRSVLSSGEVPRETSWFNRQASASANEGLFRQALARHLAFSSWCEQQPIVLLFGKHRVLFCNIALYTASVRANYNARGRPSCRGKRAIIQQQLYVFSAHRLDSNCKGVIRGGQMRCGPLCTQRPRQPGDGPGIRARGSVIASTITQLPCR